MDSCALCSATSKLEQSHVIPQFVYRGLQQPGGPTVPLLCGECEDRFSLWESQFARDVFHPLVAGRAVPVKYGPWLLKFATSVCWRVLAKARRENPLEPIPAGDCLKTWQDFLRGRRPDTGAHHLYLARELEERGRGAIESKITGDKDADWVCVKMGPVSLHGLIHGDFSPGVNGIRIHREGKLKPAVQVVPPLK